ncbi:ABC transporter substrate-binding protein [Flindersiella endophytica]
MPNLSVRSVVAAVAVAGLLSLAACSSGTQTTASSASSASSAAKPTHAVRHALGTAEAPVSPKRVVVADPDLLATALLLGVPVVGTAKPQFSENLPPFIDREKLSKIADIGWLAPKVERIAELRPDLIIGTKNQLGETYDQLRQVAPTVVFDHDGGAKWKQTMRDIASALGKRAAMDHEIGAYEKRIAAFKAGPGKQAQGVDVALVNVRDLNDIRVYTPRWCSGQVLQEAGLTRPAAQQKPDKDKYFVKLSAENLQKADAEVMFYFASSIGTNPDEAKRAVDRLRDTGLWTGLNAVKRGQAHQVDARWWFVCGTVQSANLILDDLEKTL